MNRIDKKIGFIGAGNMTQALCKGFISGELVSATDIIASDTSASVRQILADYGVPRTQNNRDVAACSSVVFISVKPHIVEHVLNEVSPVVHKDHLIVSVAAGITIKALEKLLPEGTRVIRVVPNTPSVLGCGASVYSPNNHATEEDCKLVCTLLSAVGTCDRLAEYLLDAACGLSGSGPAYGYVAIEALADGGVKMGLPRRLAIKLAAQTLLGAAKMVLETDQHPAQLKDAVTSPGGCTICALHELESKGFRAALISAVEASTNKCKEMGGS